MKPIRILSVLMILVLGIPQMGICENASEAYRRWTYQIKKSDVGVGRMYVDCTLVGRDLIDAWLEDTESDQARERILTVYSAAIDRGIFVFLLNIRMKSNNNSVYADYSDISRNAALYIADAQGGSYSPAYYSGNLNLKLHGGQNHYGLIAFRTGENPLSFQTLTLDGTYHNELIEADNQRARVKRPRQSSSVQQFQFSYLPYGVNESERPGSAPDMGDIFGMLEMALNIMSKLL